MNNRRSSWLLIYRKVHQESKGLHQVTQYKHKEKEKTHQEKLTKQQIVTINFCSIPRTAKEILDRVGVVSQSRARKRDVTPLVEKNLLEMTIPDTPNDRNQKYGKEV